jgi:hypothetical protein
VKFRKTAVFSDLSRPRIGETIRPVASGVHISPVRRAVFGALGLTASYKDGPEVQSEPSHPTEERTLDGLDAA